MNSLHLVLLTLARNPKAGYPQGDDQRGYRIVAPLTADGQIDLPTWRADKNKCTVDRFSPVATERADGWLSHRGSQWFFRYDEDEEGPDEPIFRLGEHTFRVGEYITVQESGEEPLVYRVSDVQAFSS